jgi:hypothetical protein
VSHTIAESSTLRVERGDPLEVCRRWLAQQPAQGNLLVVPFALPQYWLEGQPPIMLAALYCLRGGRLAMSVTDQALVSTGLDGAGQFSQWLERYQLPEVYADTPLGLLPHFEPKPWGQEIWYTGVEQRGVCEFEVGGRATPIPWLQAVLPQGAAGPVGQPLVLLKILDPAAAEVVGDLYFELHREKREVYVVTHVDSGAWPGGTGYIRYGFNGQRLAEFGSDELFRESYLKAVLAYQAVRRALDGQASSQLSQGELEVRERELREEMNGFTALKPLQVGDVVKVPLLLPHSLQHGVRTIEFQTPVYERQILSFAQKVLTQDHWDTQEAVAQMLLEPPEVPPFEVLPSGEGVRVERIVDFADFDVLRLVLDPGAAWLPALNGRYGLLIVVSGTLVLGGQLWRAEQACLIPPACDEKLTSGVSGQALTLLLARPVA